MSCALPYFKGAMLIPITFCYDQRLNDERGKETTKQTDRMSFLKCDT